MTFEQPLWLLLTVPVLLLVTLVFFKQRSALRWITSAVAASRRPLLTGYRTWSLVLHMLLLAAIGTCLSIAMAGPYRRGEIESQVHSGSIILCIDASLSMLAQDAEWNMRKISRFDAAQKLALQIVEKHKENRIGLLTFSGAVAYHSPPTTDHAAIKEMLNNLKEHAWGQTGSSFSGVLGGLLRMSGKQDAHAILFSDGEIPDGFADPYEETLPLLAKNGLRIHSVLIGSESGVEMKIFDPADVIAQKKDKRVALEVHTVREVKHLRTISDQTNGALLLLENGHVVEDLTEALAESANKQNPVTMIGKEDLAGRFLSLALLLLLLEGAWLASARISFFRKALVLLPFLPFFLQCRTDLWQAHLYNEQGLVFFAGEQMDPALGAFQKSEAVGVRSEIPLYNQARVAVEQGNFSEAHRLYEEALLRDPELAAAIYNDGVLLYQWGRKEIDPTGCNLTRTRELWQAALLRFQSERLLDTAHEAQARENAEAVAQALAQLKESENCPPPPTAPQNENEPDPSAQPQAKPENPGEDPGAGANPPATDPQPQPGSGQLTPEQEARLQVEMERIRKNAEGIYFAQSEQSQMGEKRLKKWQGQKEAGTEEAEGSGPQIWW